MQTENMQATWAGFNVGGANNPQRTLTVKLNTEQADRGPVGNAILEEWPMLQAALHSRQDITIAEAAAGILGDGEHIVRVWGLDASVRHEHSEPLLVVKTARLSGNLKAEVMVNDGAATAKLTLKLKAPAGDWSAGFEGKPWNPREIDQQQGNDIWVDIIAAQPELDGVAPTNRGKPDDAQEGLALGGES